MNPATVAHDRSKIEVVLYSDQSVKALKISNKMWSDAYSSGGSALYYPALTNVLADFEEAK